MCFVQITFAKNQLGFFTQIICQQLDNSGYNNSVRVLPFGNPRQVEEEPNHTTKKCPC